MLLNDMRKVGEKELRSQEHEGSQTTQIAHRAGHLWKDFVNSRLSVPLVNLRAQTPVTPGALGNVVSKVWSVETCCLFPEDS